MSTLLKKLLPLIAALAFIAPAFADTIGYAATPPSAGNTNNEHAFCSPLYTMPVGGTFTSVHMYGQDEGDGTQEAQIRVYDESGNTVATSAVGSGFSSGGSWVSMSISFSRTISQQIRFCALTEGAPLYIGRDDTTTAQGFLHYGPNPFSTWPTDPVSFNNDEDWTIALYGTYTPSSSTLLMNRRRH